MTFLQHRGNLAIPRTDHRRGREAEGQDTTECPPYSSAWKHCPRITYGAVELRQPSCDSSVWSIVTWHTPSHGSARARISTTDSQQVTKAALPIGVDWEMLESRSCLVLNLACRTSALFSWQASTQPKTARRFNKRLDAAEVTMLLCFRCAGSREEEWRDVPHHTDPGSFLPVANGSVYLWDCTYKMRAEL